MLDPMDMAAFFKMLRTNLGINMALDKEYLLTSRLAPLAKSNGYANLSAFLKAMVSTPVGQVHAEAFEAMTTKETYFFRDAHPFEALKTVILPKIIEARKLSRQLTVWSAASSTGQEAYSMAILLNDHFPQLLNWNIKILGTDISDIALNKARSGVYSAMEVSRGLTPTQIENNFNPQTDGTYSLKEHIRSNVTFQNLNLMDSFAGLPSFDLILIRNVLIYFEQTTRMDILRKVSAVLAKRDGCLMLGASESILENNPFKQVNLPKCSYFTALK